MVCSGICKFLGVSSGKNDKGEYYRAQLFDPSGEALRLYCTQDAFNSGMMIPFGKDCEVELSIRSYNGRNFVSVESIAEC